MLPPVSVQGSDIIPRSISPIAAKVGYMRFGSEQKSHFSGRVYAPSTLLRQSSQSHIAKQSYDRLPRMMQIPQMKQSPLLVKTPNPNQDLFD